MRQNKIIELLLVSVKREKAPGAAKKGIGTQPGVAPDAGLRLFLRQGGLPVQNARKLK